MNREPRNVKFNKGDGFPIIAVTPERNSKCNCGSGKKTKNCCGTQTKLFSTKTERITKRLGEQKLKDVKIINKKVDGIN